MSEDGRLCFVRGDSEKMSLVCDESGFHSFRGVVRQWVVLVGGQRSGMCVNMK